VEGGRLSTVDELGARNMRGSMRGERVVRRGGGRLSKWGGINP